MSDLFGSSDPPQQDPVATKLAADERARAEAARVRATQDQLRVETGLRTQRNSIRSLLGSFGSGSSLLGSG